MVDSHCHLADRAFADDLDAVIGRARAAGLRAALCVLSAEDAFEATQARRVAALWPEARFSIGVHPHQARDFAGRLASLGDLVGRPLEDMPRPCAVGEIGLDYHYDLSPRDVQRAAFGAQIALARATGRPIVVHTREADADTLDLLRAEGGGEVRGVFHCFTGDRALAAAALDLGFHVSFSGIVTFPRASDLRAVAALVPLDRLLVETDCPYLAPVPHRGHRNEPAWTSFVVDVLAQTRRVPAAEIAEAVAANFEALFASGEPEGPSAGLSAR